MALVNLKDRIKEIVIIVINLLAGAILGFAGIFEWSLELWVPITSVIVIVLDTVFAIRWQPPKKPSDDTGGSS